jgi:pimeloyl-ACP methyl ester carboxylesterase
MRTLFAPVLLCSTMSLAANALAHEVLSFNTSSHSTSPVSGQIEWAAGGIDKFDGKVIVLIPPPDSVDRDGWNNGSGDPGRNRLPYRDLADALVSRGYAVARFDSPGVQAPERSCREWQLSATKTKKECTEHRRAEWVPLSRHQDNVGEVLATLRDIVPAAGTNTVLFAIADGMSIAGEATARAPDDVAAVIALGGAAATDAAARRQAGSLAAAKMPFLLIQGSRGRYTALRKELERLNATGKATVPAYAIQYKKRYRLLSERGDADWFEPGFAQTLTEHVDEFLTALPVRQ